MGSPVIWGEVSGSGVGITTLTAYDLNGNEIESREIPTEGSIITLAANGNTVVFVNYTNVITSIDINTYHIMELPTTHGGTIGFSSGVSESNAGVNITFSGGKFRARIIYSETVPPSSYYNYDLYYESIDGLSWELKYTLSYDGVYYDSWRSQVFDPVNNKYILRYPNNEIKVSSDLISFNSYYLPLYDAYLDSLLVVDGYLWAIEYYSGYPYRIKNITKYDGTYSIDSTYSITLPSGVTYTQVVWYNGLFADQYGIPYAEVIESDGFSPTAEYKISGSNFIRTIEDLGGTYNLYTRDGIRVNHRNEYILVGGQRVTLYAFTSYGTNAVKVLGPGITETWLTLRDGTEFVAITDGYDLSDEFWTEEDQCVETEYTY